VVGKWLAGWATSLAVLAPAGLFALMLSWFGNPDSGPIVAGLCGLVLLTAALAGVGVLGSALSSSQPVAAMVAFFASLLLWFAHLGSASVTIGGFLAQLSFSEHLRSFAGGAFDLSDVTFFAVVASVALIAAVGAVDGRRLR
jgi:ABC-2 type transport system permease protein